MHRPISRVRTALHIFGTILVIGVSLTAFLAVGKRSGSFGRSFELVVKFDRVDGLRSGDQVRLQGLRVGSVSRIDPPAKAGDPLTVRLRIEPEIARILRSDCTATIAAQGMIGQPVVELSTGSPEAVELDLSKPLTGRTNDGIAQLTRRASQALTNLEKLTEDASVGVKQLNAITAVIARGEGSLGQLVMNDDAYRKLVDVGDQGQRTLEDLQENLESLKHSWFFSRMFDERGFYDRETILYDPTSDQIRQSLAASELFESGTAILTPLGRSRIDRTVATIKGSLRPDSRIIVAAFSEPGSGRETLNQHLTQRQAETVRDYLEREHRISYVNLFRSRKVTAVGFGSRSPTNWHTGDAPPGRVDLVVATPRTDRS
jgi:phospholipid/cholesterol/gamma-HCH transport system substrate-binding protein